MTDTFCKPPVQASTTAAQKSARNHGHQVPRHPLPHLLRQCCACCRLYTASGRLLLAIRHCRGFFNETPYDEKVLSVLEKLLDAEFKAEGICADDDGEVYTIAKNIYYHAYLVQRKCRRQYGASA